MSKTTEKPRSAEAPSNPGITKRVSVRKTRRSPVKVFLRVVYWLLILSVLAVVVYISLEAGWLIYSNQQR